MIPFAFALLGCTAHQDMYTDELFWIPNNQRVIRWMEKNVDQRQQVVTPRPIEDQVLPDLLRGTSFHTVHYREYPMAMAPPQPMATRSVFSVDSKGNVVLYKKRDDLRKAFIAMVKPINKGNLKALGLGYLKVATEFDQDGFFQFVFDEKNVKTSGDANDHVMVACSPVVEKGGDTGQLTVTMTFGPTNSIGVYKLLTITEKDTVKPGIRPICQCTLLLDPNPIVRKMAERDLLVMGKSAFPYMREQLAMAAPALKKEIERVWKRIERGER